MKKILNGIEVDVPEEEAAQFRAEWTANAQPVVPSICFDAAVSLGVAGDQQT
jgi:hypothetical protein